MDAPRSIQISVTDLVEFSAKTGDLHHHQNGPTKEEGIKGHLYVQKSRGDDWQKEVPLKHTVCIENYQITLQGRADLVYEDFISTIIEEIKTSYYPPEDLPKAKKDLHLAQAKVYAYLYAKNCSEEHPVDVRLTWFDVTRRTIHSHSQRCQLGELQAFTFTLLTIYIEWLSTLEKSRENARRACQALDFPFADFRPRQREFSSLVYQAIRDQTNLLIEAPTGSGKTMATIFPTIKAFGEGLVQQMCYLTLKNSASSVAESSVKLMCGKRVPLSYTRLQAKDKACPCRQLDANTPSLNADGMCPRTIGYYDRLPAARFEALADASLDSDTLQKIATDYNLCPFEFSLEMARWSHIVICDVNYFFDPAIRLSFFDKHGHERALLIDEIHNLIDRGRQMYSVALDTYELSKLRKSFAETSKNTVRALDKLIRCIESLGSVDTEFSSPPTPLVQALEHFIAEHQRGNNPTLETEKAADSFTNSPLKTLFGLYKFQMMIERYTPAHIVIYHKQARGGQVTLFCRDPAELLAKCFTLSRSNIGFSATLTPIDYFQKTLGLDRHTKAYALPPIFPPERQLSMRCDYIDTRWQAREQSLNQLSSLIHTLQAAKPGNYLVFLPSYSYLEALKNRFCEQYPHVSTICQERGTGEIAQQRFISTFMSRGKIQQQTSLLGFAILGGIFGEGVDYSGEALSGAIVVGLGMPQPGREQKLMQSYYQRQDLDGFQRVYQFPGLVRVLQTCGRVIRSETDKGIVVLVDPRLRQQSFSQLIPKHWQIKAVASEIEAEQLTHVFWQEE